MATIGTREILANNIKLLMKQSAIGSQTQLANLTGISLTQINNILRHKTGATVDLLQRLADGLDCEPWLLLMPATLLDQHSSKEVIPFVYCYMRLRPNAQGAVWSITQELYEATRETLYL